MAKFGEGDKRWIVSDRADGTNVHNWHWVERDCLEWSRSLLSSLLSNLTLLNNEPHLFIRTKTLDNLHGEAYINVRKGKVIPGYELSFSLPFEAETRDAEPFLRLNGSIDVPYLADENAAEDPEIRVTVRDDDGPVARRIKDALLARGKPVVLEKIRLFVQAMSKGGPAKEELEEKMNNLSSAAKVQVKGEVLLAAGRKESGDVSATKMVKKEKEGFKTIKLTERFSCRARDVYEILMEENRWKGFTQSNAVISKEVGGRFSLFDGSISGVNEELKEGKLIVQKWRFNNWADGVYSLVR